MKKIIKKLGSIFLNILVTIAIIILIICIYIIYEIKIQNKQYASIFGYTILEVVTGSMADTINIGDLIIVHITKDVNVGDIIVYSENNNLITHRVIDMTKDNLTTKGDNNNAEDDPITINDVVGKEIFILKNFGILKDVFSSPIVFSSIFITIVLFGIAILYKPKQLENDNKN